MTRKALSCQATKPPEQILAHPLLIRYPVQDRLIGPPWFMFDPMGSGDLQAIARSLAS